MSPLEKESPDRRIGAQARVYGKCEICLFNSRNFQKFQVLSRLIFLQALIGPCFEPELSLAIDRALRNLEALREGNQGGPVHVGVVVEQVIEDLARRRVDRGQEIGVRHG